MSSLQKYRVCSHWKRSHPWWSRVIWETSLYLRIKMLGRKTGYQINRTLTDKCGVIRGLHFQYSPCAEAKCLLFERCCLWCRFDLRKFTYVWNFFFDWIECIQASGFNYSWGLCSWIQTITDNVEMVYFHSCDFSPEHQSGINAFDECLNIPWPKNAQRSRRDQSLPKFDSFKGLCLWGVDIVAHRQQSWLQIWVCNRLLMHIYGKPTYSRKRHFFHFSYMFARNVF